MSSAFVAKGNSAIASASPEIRARCGVLQTRSNPLSIAASQPHATDSRTTIGLHFFS